MHDKIAEPFCLVLKVWPAPRTQALRRRRTGRDSSIHDRLVKASPLVDRTHFKFVDVSYSGSVNFLLHKAYTPDAIVVWVQIRLIRRPQCWRNEVWHLSLQESDGVACSMRQCTVLLKDKTQPWDFRNMSGSSFLARRLSRYYAPFTLTTRRDQMDLSAAINKLLFKRYVKIQ